MRQNLFLISISLIAIVFISGCAQYGGQQSPVETQEDGQSPTQGQQSSPPASPATGKTIEIMSSKFSPDTLTIGVGETVTWINKDSVSHWPASAVHPTHAVYPEAGGCMGSKFDACKALSPGESFSFTFNQKGTWGYHDHLNPTLTGTIIVGD